MFAIVFTSLKTVIASKATIVSKAFLKTFATVVAFALSFLYLVCPVLVILFILIRVIVQGKSSDKELL
jgi:hypothetical protein